MCSKNHYTTEWTSSFGRAVNKLYRNDYDVRIGTEIDNL